jgi:hypothetical protein
MRSNHVRESPEFNRHNIMYRFPLKQVPGFGMLLPTSLSLIRNATLEIRNHYILMLLMHKKKHCSPKSRKCKPSPKNGMCYYIYGKSIDFKASQAPLFEVTVCFLALGYIMVWLSL